MGFTRFASQLILLSLLLYQTLSYTLEGIFPDAGPVDGSTRVTVYSPSFLGLNYSSHPKPRCKFADSEPEIASWIHCAGANPDAPKKDQTCLNCESTPHAAGNVSVQVSISGDFTDTAEISFHYYEQPIVSWAEPFIGKKPGGTLVHVHGKNFEDLPALGCAFGAKIVPATFISSTLISCRAPVSEVVDAVIPLKVTQNVQQASDSWIKYYYYTVPEISQVIPDSGPTTGGTEVYIKGRQMYPFQVSDLYIDNTTYLSFGKGHYVRGTLVNTTHIKAVAPPALVEGPVPVELTFNDQEWTSDGIPFYYYIPPYVLELVPNFGAVQGGTNVTVLGANFYDSPDIKCKFGDNVVEGHYIDATKIWCLSPPANKSGYVTFGLALTKDRYSGKDLKYLYIDPPVITSLTPMCGPTSGYTQIAVVGKNFVYTGLNKALCIFGDDYKQTATVVNESLIYCDSPAVIDKHGRNHDNIWKLPLKITLNQVDFLNANKDFVYYTQPSVTSISPLNGPTAGGTSVVVQGDNITNYCDLTCRFGTMEVKGELGKNNQVTCISPGVTCPGETVVQVSLNRQQYTSNQYDLYQTVFYYYQNIIVAYVSPSSLPTAGGSQVTVFGEGFLMSRNSTTAPDGKVIISYQCRFKTESGDIISTDQALYVDNNIIKCPTPRIEDPVDNAVLEVSPNGQNWEPIILKNLTFFRAPEVIAVDPKFGKIKQKNSKLTVNGKYFDCPDSDCSDVKCAFTTPDMRVISEGTRQNSNTIICNIPPISRPEVTTVQVTLNGIDYTTQNVTYTFYDAFVLSADPPYVPVEGNTIARLNGYGFADTGEVQVQLLDESNNVLNCRGYPCVIDGKYISQNEVQFTVPPQADVKDSAGNSIGFKPFVAEVSVYDSTFTQNGVEIQYFEQPVVNAMTPDGSPFTFHSNAVETVRVPITLKVPPGTTKANFLNFAKVRCRFQVGGNNTDTAGVVMEYPFPTDNSVSLDELSRIQCPTPKTDNTGSGTVGVSLNGRDFVGSIPILVKPELKLLAVTPQCGPKAGGTPVSMNVAGIDDYDFGKLFFTWSTVCTDLLTKEMLTSPNTLATSTPPVAYLDNSPGGTSLAVFSVNRVVEFSNGTQTQNARNYLDSSAEFLYYITPQVIHTYPHSGTVAGGTPVIVDGAFFFTDPRHSCTPKCKFGDQTVEAEWISTVRLRCLSPAGKEGLVVPLTITMNGKDETPIVKDQSFTFSSRPVIENIHPTSGPTSGGTPILVSGQNYVDLSSYPEEFLCHFSSVNTKIPPKSTPASFLNNTAIMCTSPGGWGAGNIARLQITYNGVDMSNDNNTFRFYQVDTIVPVGGPAVGGNNISILGSGFETNLTKSQAACKINEQVTAAISVNWTTIVCPAPPAVQGPNYYGHDQFYYTLDGVDWHQIIQGYTYYQQPALSKVIPPWIPKEGGRVTVVGDKFVNDYYGTKLTCKIGNTYVPAQFINSTHLNCTFLRIDAPTEQDQFISIALNDVSYTPADAATKIYVFYVTKMSPQSGVLEGGTLLQLEGVNFPPNAVPLCRFGIKGGSSITFGNRIGGQQLTCTTPASNLPAVADYPLEVMFSLSFESDIYKTWAWEGLHFYYYRQPEILSVQPKSALLDQTTAVNITSTVARPFNDSLIGSVVTNDVRMLNTDIVCRFGRFGTTKGALISNTEVSCPTPNTKMNLEEVGEEPVKMEVAMNGQDFSTASSVYFKFVGTKSPTNYGIIWILAIIIGAAVLGFLLYFISKAFSGTSGVGVESTGSVQKNSYPGPNRSVPQGPQSVV